MLKEIVVEYKGETLGGTLIKEDSEFITMKLNSGYNAVLKKSNLKILSQTEINELNNIKTNQNLNSNIKKQDSKNLPKITILHTGGTIASKVDYNTGAVSSKFKPEELLNLYPELNNIANIESKMIGNLFSEDMRFSHYNFLLREIDMAIKNKVDGIIISHGTDTMHYSAIAIHYAVKNLPCPIIFVGAQRSSDRPSSDAFTNLRAGLEFIIKCPNYKRVGICMHKDISDFKFVILDAVNSRKMHTSRRDAFEQINYFPVCEISDENIEIFRNDLITYKKTEQEFKYIKYNESLKIGFFKAHPNLFSKEIEMLSFYEGVVIEGTGLGHLAVDVEDEKTNEHKEILDRLKELCNKTKVVMASQCINGRVNLSVYSSGRKIKAAGVLGHLMNLTSETLFIRLAYCLSNKEEDFNSLWVQNLEGFDSRDEDIKG